MSLIIETFITQSHIDKGMPNTCGLCPISLAVKDKLRELGLVTDDSGCVFVMYEQSKIVLRRDFAMFSSYTCNNDRAVRDFVKKFDEGMRPKPMPLKMHFHWDKNAPRNQQYWRERIDMITAYLNGAEIEHFRGRSWQPLNNVSFDGDINTYRIKGAQS